MRIRNLDKKRLLFRIVMHSLKVLVQVKPDPISQKITENSFAMCIKKSLLKFEKPQYFTSYDLPENMIFVPGAIRRKYFYNDLNTLINSSSCKIINAYFKNINQKMDFEFFAKSYSGVPLGNIDLCGVDREKRTTYLRILSGRHFCSENMCIKFRRSKSSCCPFCKDSSRNLFHYILDCSKFASIRNTFIDSISKINSDVCYDLKNENSVYNLFSSENHDILKTFCIFLQEIKTKFEE